MIADCPTRLRPDELPTFGDLDGSAALATNNNNNNEDSCGEGGVSTIAQRQRIGTGGGGAGSDYLKQNGLGVAALEAGVDGSGGRPAISPRSPTQQQYHHYRRRPLLMLFQSDEARVASSQLVGCGVVPSRFMVSPTPNALPAATAPLLNGYPDAPSSPISKALRHPLRVIVAADDKKSGGTKCGDDTPSPLSPASSPEMGGCEMTKRQGQPAKPTTVTAGAVSPASISSVDSGVVLTTSGAARGSDLSPPLHLDSRRVLFTIAGEVVPPSSQYNFTEVNSVRTTTLTTTTDSLAIMMGSESGGWKFRERSVSECFVEARQLTMRRQQCILEEEDEKADSPSPAEHNPPPPHMAVDTTTTTTIVSTPNSPLVVMSKGSSGGIALKGILKKSSVYSSQQLSTSKSAPHHFRRAPTYFALCRSVSDLSSSSGEERIDRSLCIPPSMELEDGCDLRSNLLRMNHQFNAMILENLSEEKTPDDSENICSSPPQANNEDGSGSLGSLVSADSGDSMIGAGDGGSGAEIAAEMQPRKKRVSFSEHVQARIYRSNSSILGQRKKNEKKHRNKRRRSESESSTTSPTDEHNCITDTRHAAVPVAERRDSGIEDESPPPNDFSTLNVLHQSRPLSLDVALGTDAEEAEALGNGTKCPPTSPTSPQSKRMKRLVSADSALGEDVLVIAATMTMVGIGMAGDVH